MGRPLACLFGWHLWSRCQHLYSATKVHWHCDRCGGSKTTYLPE